VPSGYHAGQSRLQDISITVTDAVSSSVSTTKNENSHGKRCPKACLKLGTVRNARGYVLSSLKISH
jgi:hypothetical protein